MQMRNKSSSLLRIAGMLVIISLLSACGRMPKPPSEANAVYTSAAATVAFQLTQQGPLRTIQAPSTATAKPLPTKTQAAPATPNVPTAASTVPAGNPTSALPPAAEKYELVTQDPLDNFQVPAGLPFKVTWTIKNTGTTTWTKDFTLVFFVGERMGAGLPNSYTFTAEVKPGESYNAVADFISPANKGTYMSWWKFKNKDGQNFGDATITILSVGDPVTATSGVSASPAAATITPTP